MFLNFNALSCQSEYNKRVIVQTCLIQILEESSVLYLFLECFIISLFGVLVTWKRDLYPTIIFTNHTM